MNTYIKLPPPQRSILTTFFRPKVKGDFQDTENVELNKYIKQLRKQYPESFQDDTSQRLRVFYDQPHSDIPYARAIRKQY